MLRKRDYEDELRKGMTALSQRHDHAIGEIDAICKTMPVRVMKDGRLFASFCMDRGFSLRDSLTVLSWVMSQSDFLDDMKVSADISYVDACKAYGLAQTNLIIVHRLNYMLHECMLMVRDVLERNGKLRFAVKKGYNEAEKVWDRYYHDRRRMIEDTAWYTLSDHLRLADNAISPYREKVYEAIRDYMIGLGVKDVELKGRCAVFFLMGKVAGHSYRHFFEDFERESGADFSECFRKDDLYEMVERFADVCGLIGVDTISDDHGYLRLGEFDPEKSQRFLWAWDGLMKALRDDDLMDAMAKNAIDLNPKVKEDYEHVLAEEEERQMETSIGQLSDKYKVRRL